jgi:GNAT superfamily N-acetyltransferase
MNLTAVESLIPAQRDDLHQLFRKVWWADHRTRDDVDRVLSGSDVVVGLCTDAGDLVGFARALSDGAFRAFVYDVIVSAEFQGEGVGALVLDELLARPAVANAEQVELYCQPDLVGFYEQRGFSDDLDVRLMWWEQ